MAKTSKPAPTRPYPSEFGSHAVMVDAEETAKLPEKKTVDVVWNGEPVREDGQISIADLVHLIKEPHMEKVVCKDQFGFYITEKWRLDNNQADPNRWAGSRIKIQK